MGGGGGGGTNRQVQRPWLFLKTFPSEPSACESGLINFKHFHSKRWNTCISLERLGQFRRKSPIPHTQGSNSPPPGQHGGQSNAHGLLGAGVCWSCKLDQRLSNQGGCGHQRRLNYITSFLLLIDFINEAISRITPRDDRKRLINLAFSSQVFKHYFKHTEGNRRIENSTFQTGHLSQSVSVLHLTLVTNLIPWGQEVCLVHALHVICHEHIYVFKLGGGVR